jgi:hypothetical protein
LVDVDFHQDGIHAFVMHETSVNNVRHFYLDVYILRNESSKFVWDHSFELLDPPDFDLDSLDFGLLDSGMKTHQVSPMIRQMLNG